MTLSYERNRRHLLTAGLGGATLLLGGCAGRADAAKDEKEVMAAEDLMREHGVLRRALLAYEAAVPRLRRKPAAVPPDALNRTARLFRSFGEDYHERQLEEAFIFPTLRQAGGPVAALCDALLQQHQRGREVTDYVLARTHPAAFGKSDGGKLANVLEAMVRMYQHHAAREDTIIFPAWKDRLSGKQYEEMGDRFEEIERRQFGRDGFADAVREIGEIEQMLGLADIAQFTAPPPRA